MSCPNHGTRSRVSQAGDVEQQAVKDCGHSGTPRVSEAGFIGRVFKHQWVDNADAALLAGAAIVAIILCIIVSRIKLLVQSQAGTDSFIPLQLHGRTANSIPHPGGVTDWFRWLGSSQSAIRSDQDPSKRSGTSHNSFIRKWPWQRDAGVNQAVSKDAGVGWGTGRPLVIAHRGASGKYPEHTRAAYEAAIQMGADIIECDVVLTKDLVGLCRHDANLEGSTDVKAKFPHKRTTYRIDGQNVTGIFASDLTLAETQQLRAVQPWPFRDQQYNGKFPLVTLNEYLDIALSAGRIVGVYPETKNPTWHNSLPHVKAANTSIEQVLLQALTQHGYAGPINSVQWSKQPAFIQSFETGSLEVMSHSTQLPLIQLLGSTMSEQQPDGQTVQQLLEGEGFERLRRLVTGVGPGKQLLVQWQAHSREGHGSRHGTGKGTDARHHQHQEHRGSSHTHDSHTERHHENSNAGSYISSEVVEKLHAAGLQVHPYTLRKEPWFVLPRLLGNATAEMDLLFNTLHVDAAFTDYADSMVQFLNQTAA